jgi:ABC-type multidrug transport system ATPase subunit
MTLLLGPPSSGKTTLWLALAGKLDPGLRVWISLIDFLFHIIQWQINKARTFGFINPDSWWSSSA